ncbi:hypothetical protein [Methylocystis echinoides]|nr:hypothetical protein [Methylocystis echinoides]
MRDALAFATFGYPPGERARETLAGLVGARLCRLDALVADIN